MDAAFDVVRTDPMDSCGEDEKVFQETFWAACDLATAYTKALSRRTEAIERGSDDVSKWVYVCEKLHTAAKAANDALDELRGDG